MTRSERVGAVMSSKDKSKTSQKQPLVVLLDTVADRVKDHSCSMLCSAKGRTKDSSFTLFGLVDVETIPRGLLTNEQHVEGVRSYSLFQTAFY